MARGRRTPAPGVTQPVVTPVTGDQPTVPVVTFVEELRSTQVVARRLLGLMERTEAEALPSDGAEAMAALRDFAEAKIPTARALARAALAGGFDQSHIYMLWARTRRAFHAASPAVMDMFLAKMENEHLPYSERLLVEAMKGLGLLTPDEPTKSGEREDMLTRSDLRSMTQEELDRKLAEGMGE